MKNAICSRCRIRHSGSVAAFTLVELLVSITVLAIVVVMFSQSLGSILTGWSTAQEKMDNFAKARTALSRLQVDLNNLVDRGDLANFGLDGDRSVLGFYTLQRGIGSGGSDARSLSYVEYAPGDDDRGEPALFRYHRTFTFADGDAPEFLPAPTPSPSSTPPEPTPEAVDTSTLDDLIAVRGLVGFSYGFLHPDGNYSASYYRNSSNEPSRAIAVKVGVVITDNRTAAILEERGKLDSLVSDLEIKDPPSGSNWSPKAIWDYQLGFSDAPPTNPGGAGSSPSRVDFDDYGGRFLDSVRSFERTYTFPSGSLTAVR